MEEMAPILHKELKGLKKKKEKIFPNLSNEVIVTLTPKTDLKWKKIYRSVSLMNRDTKIPN